MPTPPTPIVAPGTAPDLTDSATFDARAYAWTIWERDHQVPETNALGANVYANAVEAHDGAATAIAAAALASASAGALLFNAATSYTIGQAAISGINFITYRNSLGGVDATDPASDTTGRWVNVGLPPVNVVDVASNFTFAAGVLYRLTGSCNGTIPALGSINRGDVFSMTVSGAFVCSMLSNGHAVNGVVQDVLLDYGALNKTVSFIYTGPTTGLILC